MKNKSYIGAVLLFFLLLPIYAQEKKNDFTQNLAKGMYNSPAVFPVVFMQDENYTSLGTDGKSIIKYQISTGKMQDTLFHSKDSSIVKIEDYRFSVDERKILIRTNTDQNGSEYFVCFLVENRIERLSEKGKQLEAVFSPNGRMVAFVRDHNVYLKKLDYGTEIAVTEDGEAGKTMNGMPDAAYQKAFSASRFFEWSPDSKFLAFVRFDETKVNNFCFDVYPEFNGDEELIGVDVKRHCNKYTMPGTAIPHASVMVYDPFYKTTKEMNIMRSGEMYIPRILWTLDEDQLAIVTLNRNQNKLNLVIANPRSTVCNVILKDEVSHYINIDNIRHISFLPGHQFVYLSEKSGYNHLSLYSNVGILKQQLTSGKWDVTGFYGYDAEKKVYYYQSSENSPLERDIYSIQAGGKKTLLSKEKGTHQAVFSPGFDYYLDYYSSTEVPGRVAICNASGHPVWKLKAEKLVQTEDLLPKELFSFTTNQQVKLNGWIVKPAMVDNKKYPVLICSGKVQNEWSAGIEQFLVRNNYVVVCVEDRKATARGTELRQSSYMQIGSIEARDLLDAAAYLSTLPYIDKNRIGALGWGTDGLTCLLAMSSDENVFKAGIVIAPVTDWRFYNGTFTERYMRRPQENFTQYKHCSPLESAGNLQGRLLLIQGMADEDISLQQAFMYTQRLTKLNKSFEMQLYTNGNHCISNESDRIHLYNRIRDFVLKNL